MNEGDGEHYLVATVLAFTSLLCLFMNAGVAWAWSQSSEAHSSFVQFSVSLAVADCGVLAVYLFAVTPATYLQNAELTARWPGHVGLFFWFASFYAMLAIAANRYVAIRYPGRFQTIFSQTNTHRLICAGWSLAAVQSLFYFVPGCHLAYDPATYVYYYVQSNCFAITSFIDFGYGITISITLLSINTLTGLRIRKQNKTVQTAVAGNRQQDKELADRFKKEVRFFVQSLINSLVFVSLVVSFNVISRLFSGKLAAFVTTTWMWQLSHGTNGFLVFGLNGRVRRRFLFLFLRVGQASSTNVPSAVQARQRNNGTASRK